MTSIELPYVTVSFDAPVVHFKYKEGAELGYREMRELISTAEKLSWSKPYFTFSDVRVKMSVTPEGKFYLSDLRNLPLFRGAAVLVQNKMLSFAVNFLSHFSSKKYPFKAFTDKEKCLRWLNTLPLDNPDAQWQLE